MQRLFNTAPNALFNDKPVMYRDKSFSYGKCFLLGMDFDFMMLHVCLLSFLNRMLRGFDSYDVKFIVGILFAYLIDCFLVWMRAYYGKRNFAKHTLIGE